MLKPFPTTHCLFNLYTTKFLTWTCPHSLFEAVHYQLWGYQDESWPANSIDLYQTAHMCFLEAKASNGMHQVCIEKSPDRHLSIHPH